MDYHRLGLGSASSLIKSVRIADWGACVVVFLDRSNATNSGGVLGEPLAHLLVGPGPLKRVGVQAVVFRCGSHYMLDQLLPTDPRATFQVAVAKCADQQLRLIQPGGMHRREAG